MDINQNNFLYILSKIRQRLFAFLEAELANNNINDISPSYGDVLFVLDRNGPLTIQEVARYAIKDKSTVSSVIKRLEESGYVVKEKNEDDGRFVKIRLTPKSKKIKARIWEISDRMNARLFAGLTEEEMSTLFALLGKIYRNT